MTIKLFSKIKQLFFYIGITISAFILLTVLIFSWFAFSQSGLQWAVKQASSSIPGLTISTSEGRLFGKSSFNDFKYINKQYSISLDHLELNWQPSFLFNKTLSVKKIHAKNLLVKQLTAGEKKSTSANKPIQLTISEFFNSLKLPLNISVEGLKLENGGYQGFNTDKPLIIEGLDLQALINENEIDIKNLRLKSDILDLDGFVKLPINPSTNASGELTSIIYFDELYKPVNNEESIKPLKVTTTITGKLAEIKINNQLAPPYQSNITTSIEKLPKDILISSNFDLQEINLSTVKNTLPAIELNGENTFTTSLNDFTFELNTNLKLLDKEKNNSGLLIAKGNGNTEAINIEQLLLNSFLGDLKGHGKIEFKPALVAHFNLTGEKIDPEVLAADWPGNLATKIDISTELGSSNSPTINSNILITGQLRSIPINANVIGSYSDNEIKIKKGLIKSGKTEAEFLTTINTSTNNNSNNQKNSIYAEWTFDSPNLNELLPEIQGSLKSSGKIETTIDHDPMASLVQSKVIFDAQGSKLVLDQQKVETLDAKVDFDWLNKSSSEQGFITLSAKNLSFENNKIESIDFKTTGQSDKHQINIELLSDQGQVSTDLQGSLREKNQSYLWDFSLENVFIQALDFAPWQSSGSSKGQISATEQELEQTCLNSGKSQLCFNAKNKTKESGLAQFSLQQLPIDYFSELFPDGIQWAQSFIEGSGSIALPANSSPEADITLTTTAGKLVWEASEQIEESSNITNFLQLEPSNISIKSNYKLTAINLSFPFQDQQGITSYIEIQNEQGKEPQNILNGDLQLNIADLKPFGVFIPDSSDLEGNISGNWKLAGTLEQPDIKGELSLNDAQVKLNTPNIFIKNIQAKLTGKGTKGISYSASLNSGEGNLTLNGDFDFVNTKTLNLILKGENTELFNTEEISIVASPNLTISNDNNKIVINGEVDIPKARISPKQLPESVASVSEDQIIINDKQNNDPIKKTEDIHLDLKLNLGENVQVNGFGFKGNTTGSLQINKIGSEVPRANGVISILNGEYRAFGQGLVIEKGDILFSDGPVSKPGIDIKAIRRPAENITVGVFARGQIAQPKISIFSDPSMSQSEQLSWLVLGRPLEQSSEGETNALNQLLLSYSLSKGDNFVNQIGESFNLDTVNIKTGSGEAGAASDNELAELVLGKYLSPNLYISYGIGLFQPINVLSLEYTLNRFWTLKSESSSESSGGDLIYSLER
jgi:translocation and assembly module TamB